MIRAPKVGDIDDEDNILARKLHLTKNEYNATIRNKLEYSRLKVTSRHMDDQNDMNACKLRTTIHDLRTRSDDNQKVVCDIKEFLMNRKLKHSSTIRE